MPTKKHTYIMGNLADGFKAFIDKEYPELKLPPC